MRAVLFASLAGSAAAAGGGTSGSGKCSGFKAAYDDGGCSGSGKHYVKDKKMQIRPKPSTGLSLSANPCSGTKPNAAGFANANCSLDAMLEQSGINVTAGYVGDYNTSIVPISVKYRYNEPPMCPVNVHWHLGAEHLSVGEYDECVADQNGDCTAASATGPVWNNTVRRGFRCSKYASFTSAQKAEYNWKHCVGMKVGETYEVHWPHSAAGKCNTPHQFQTPFYDGVVCGLADSANTPANTAVGNLAGKQALADNVGVQGQVFTIINDDAYYYPDLLYGAVEDYTNNAWTDVGYYTGSTTGTSRSNQLCSAYAAITWQVDRKCHLMSASAFDKMCADMLLQNDDMSGDVHAHGSRELVSVTKAANNLGTLSGPYHQGASAATYASVGVANVATSTHSRVLGAQSSDICPAPTTTVAPTTTTPSGSGSMAGGDSSSSNATTTTEATVTVTGSVGLTMTLDDSATSTSMMADTSFTSSAASAIASQMTGVSASDITITNIVISSGRRALSKKRALATVSRSVTIEWSYTGTVSESTIQQFSTDMATSTTQTAFQTSLNTALANAGVSGTYTSTAVTGATVTTSGGSGTSFATRSSATSVVTLLLASVLSGFDARLSALALVLFVPGVNAAGGNTAPKMKCEDMKSMYEDAGCCNSNTDDNANGFQVVPEHPVRAGTNPCQGKKPTVNFDNVNCSLESVLEQSGANVTRGYQGTMNTTAGSGVTPHLHPYWQSKMCPVNVHWHIGAEHLSVGQYDETMSAKGPAVQGSHTPFSDNAYRLGFRCNHYDASNQKFNDSTYKWQHCDAMKVGETYEVHWPHSALGACGTPNQYQSPFYDGVVCAMGNASAELPTVAAAVLKTAVGVQGQVFTIINDEDYYYPNLFRGMIVDGTTYGYEMTYYTGSTTGTSRSNDMCSLYAPITWQVDRKCHLISASSFDKMCADMKQQRDDMTVDLHAHGARPLVSDHLAANNFVFTP